MPENGVPPHLIEEEEVTDYAFVGDISEVTIFLQLQKKLTFSYNIPIPFIIQILFTESTNIHHNPYVVASGITRESDPTNLTFSLTPSQFVNLSHSVLDCPLSCYIDPESGKWGIKKPLPVIGSTISISGFLMKIERNADRQPTFVIKLDNIAYLSSPYRQHGPASTSPVSSITASTSHHRFNYENTSNTPSSSPIALGKRKRTQSETIPYCQ